MQSEPLIRPMIESDIDRIVSNFSEQGWSKPREAYEKHLELQNNKKLFIFIAEYNNDIAGYVLLYPQAITGAFAGKNIPEIVDFNVFIKYQRMGIGNKILDVAESKAFELCDKVSLGVGLHYGYGTAQRMYIKRGYIPDGTGVWYNNEKLEQYTDCNNDDDLVLYLSKDKP